MRIPRSGNLRYPTLILWAVAASLNLLVGEFWWAAIEVFIIFLLWSLYLAHDVIKDAAERGKVWRDERNGL